MKHVFFTIIISLLFSCATNRVSQHSGLNEPQWFSSLTLEEKEGSYYLPIYSYKNSQRERSEDLSTQILSFLKKKNFFNPSFEATQKEAFYQIKTFFNQGEGPVPFEVLRFELIEGHLKKGSYYWIKIDSLLIENYIVQSLSLFFKEYSSLLEGTKNLSLYKEMTLLMKDSSIASASKKPFREYFIQNNLDKIVFLLSQINIEEVQGPKDIYTNLTIDQPFSFFIKDSQGEVLPGVEFLFSYEGAIHFGASLKSQNIRIVSDIQGRVEFFHPFISYPGSYEVHVFLGRREFVDQLNQIKSEGFNTAPVQEALQSKSFTYYLDAESAAKEQRMVLALSYQDGAKVPISQEKSSTKLVKILQEQGFNVSLVEENTLFLIRDRYKEDFDRVLIGTFIIEDFSKSANRYAVKTSVSLDVVELKSGIPLYSYRASSSAESQESQRAIDAAFYSLSKKIAKDIEANLY